MHPAILLLLQAASAEGPPDAETFDLKSFETGRAHNSSPVKGCAGPETAEIIVCGSRGGSERYRLRPLPSVYEAEALKAETGLFGGIVADVHVESVGMPDGNISKRIMITAKMKF